MGFNSIRQLGRRSSGSASNEAKHASNQAAANWPDLFPILSFRFFQNSTQSGVSLSEPVLLQFLVRALHDFPPIQDVSFEAKRMTLRARSCPVPKPRRAPRRRVPNW